MIRRSEGARSEDSGTILRKQIQPLVRCMPGRGRTLRFTVTERSSFVVVRSPLVRGPVSNELSRHLRECGPALELYDRQSGYSEDDGPATDTASRRDEIRLRQDLDVRRFSRMTRLTRATSLYPTRFGRFIRLTLTDFCLSIDSISAYSLLLEQARYGWLVRSKGEYKNAKAGFSFGISVSAACRRKRDGSANSTRRCYRNSL